MASVQPSRRDCKIFLLVAGGTFVVGLLISCLAYSSAGPEDSLVSLQTTLTQPSVLPQNDEPAQTPQVFLPQQDIETPQVSLPAQVSLPSQSDSDDKALIDMLAVKDAPAADSAEPAKEEWRKVRMRVTGYCACVKCCGKTDAVTACNYHIQKGDALVAADKSYAFGTQMIIPGYNKDNPVKVLDRGGAITGDRLDLFFHSHKQALNWGVQYLDVLVKVN